jgi:tryptophan 7-halogenase
MLKNWLNKSLNFSKSEPGQETITYNQPVTPNGKKRIAILGAGSAGMLSLTFMCAWLGNDWEVVSIHDPSKPILGIGESTNGTFLTLLQQGTGFHLGYPEDMARLDATLKFGSKFMDWREHHWVNPLLDGNMSIHFNNFGLKEFVLERMQERHSSKFRLLEGEVQGMDDKGTHVDVFVNGETHAFHYVMDCMGFPANYDAYTMSTCSPVNHCLIHSINNFEFEPHTDHLAHEHGWMFGVPLQTRKTFGYMYNDTITPKETAQRDMMRLLNVNELSGKEYIFNSYYVNEVVEGRICKNGNKALFFEPLVANSMFIYINTIHMFYDYMMGFSTREKANASFLYLIQAMEDTISYYYMGGSTHTSAFWDAAVSQCSERMKHREPFWNMMEHYRLSQASGTLIHSDKYAYAAQTWQWVDEQMGYGFIVPKAEPHIIQGIHFGTMFQATTV